MWVTTFRNLNKQVFVLENVFYYYDFKYCKQETVPFVDLEK